MEIECPIEIVPRHIHLSLEHEIILLGKERTFFPRIPLSQTGQWMASHETIFIEGSKGKKESLLFIGPHRRQTQVELSQVDLDRLGLCAPKRRSGDLSGSGGCILEGSHGRVVLQEGVILPKPHIHCSNREAKQFGWKNHQIIDITLDQGQIKIPEVIIRIHPTFVFSLHINSDDISDFPFSFPSKKQKIFL